MRKQAFFLSLSLSAACAFAGAAEPDPAQVDGTPSAVTAGGEASPDAGDAAADLSSERRNEIEKTYRANLVRTLSRSLDPRDWALASLICGLNSLVSGAGTAEASSLSARAAAAAPGDALAQWIALSQSPSAALDENALARLQSLEPGNVEVWVFALMRASQQHDANAVDDIMHRMAAGTYTDEHGIDAQKALVEAFKRNPLPDEYFALASPAPSVPVDEAQVRESMPYLESNAIIAAMATPAYLPLIAACKPQTDAPLGAIRIEDCAKVGRTMATKGGSVLANRIGFALLRITRTYTDDDVKLAREQDWTMEQFFNGFRDLFAGADEAATLRRLVARVADQNATGSEWDAMRRSLVRENIPLDPPADWVDGRSPFSAERLKQENAAAASR